MGTQELPLSLRLQQRCLKSVVAARAGVQQCHAAEAPGVSAVPSQLEELEWPASVLMFWTLWWLFLLPSLCKERKVYLSCHPEPPSTTHYYNLISEDKGSTHLRVGGPVLSVKLPSIRLEVWME